MLNQVAITGRLTRDVELKETSNGKAFARFTVAVNRVGEGADFIPVKVWNKTAENCAQYIGKGSLVAINGRIETGSYEGSHGQTVYTTDVVASNVHFLDTKGSKQKTDDDNRDPFADDGQPIVIDDDDLPF